MTPIDTRTLVTLLTQARKRKGWTLLTLSVMAGVPYQTVKSGMHRQSLGLTTALKLAQALEFTIAPPQPPRVYSAHEAQHGG